jgi:hypothetical protein
MKPEKGYDRVIQLLLTKKNPMELRKIIASSQQWPSLAEEILKRMGELAAEKNVRLSYSKRLQETRKTLMILHTELIHYNEILHEFRSAMPSEYDCLLAKHRISMHEPFFEHLGYLSFAAQNIGNNQEAETLLTLGTKIAALSQAYDFVLKDHDLIRGALQRFKDFLDGVTSFESAEKKIDEMASTGELDPALLLIISKAYSSTKHSSYTNTEVADIMSHLYFRAKEQLSKQRPPQIRILKHLLSLEDALQIEAELERALTLDESNIDGKSHDYLVTTPVHLHQLVDTILHSYKKNEAKAKLFALNMNQPQAVRRLVDIQRVLVTKYV